MSEHSIQADIFLILSRDGQTHLEFIFGEIKHRIDKFFSELEAKITYSIWKSKMPPSNESDSDLRVGKFVKHLPNDKKIEYFKELVRRKNIAIKVSEYEK